MYIFKKIWKQIIFIVFIAFILPGSINAIVSLKKETNNIVFNNNNNENYYPEAYLDPEFRNIMTEENGDITEGATFFVRPYKNYNNFIMIGKIDLIVRFGGDPIHSIVNYSLDFFSSHIISDDEEPCIDVDFSKIHVVFRLHRYGSQYMNSILHGLLPSTLEYPFYSERVSTLSIRTITIPKNLYLSGDVFSANFPNTQVYIRETQFEKWFNNPNGDYLTSIFKGNIKELIFEDSLDMHESNVIDPLTEIFNKSTISYMKITSTTRGLYTNFFNGRIKKLDLTNVRSSSFLIDDSAFLIYENESIPEYDPLKYPALEEIYIGEYCNFDLRPSNFSFRGRNPKSKLKKISFTNRNQVFTVGNEYDLQELIFDKEYQSNEPKIYLHPEHQGNIEDVYRKFAGSILNFEPEKDIKKAFLINEIKSSFSSQEFQDYQLNNYHSIFYIDLQMTVFFEFDELKQKNSEWWKWFLSKISRQISWSFLPKIFSNDHFALLSSGNDSEKTVLENLNLQTDILSYEIINSKTFKTRIIACYNSTTRDQFEINLMNNFGDIQWYRKYQPKEILKIKMYFSNYEPECNLDIVSSTDLGGFYQAFVGETVIFGFSIRWDWQANPNPNIDEFSFNIYINGEKFSADLKNYWEYSAEIYEEHLINELNFRLQLKFNDYLNSIDKFYNVSFEVCNIPYKSVYPKGKVKTNSKKIYLIKDLEITNFEIVSYYDEDVNWYIGGEIKANVSFNKEIFDSDTFLYEINNNQIDRSIINIKAVNTYNYLYWEITFKFEQDDYDYTQYLGLKNLSFHVLRHDEKICSSNPIAVNIIKNPFVFEKKSNLTKEMLLDFEYNIKTKLQEIVDFKYIDKSKFLVEYQQKNDSRWYRDQIMVTFEDDKLDKIDDRNGFYSCNVKIKSLNVDKIRFAYGDGNLAIYSDPIQVNLIRHDIVSLQSIVASYGSLFNNSRYYVDFVILNKYSVELDEAIFDQNNEALLKRFNLLYKHESNGNWEESWIKMNKESYDITLIEFKPLQTNNKEAHIIARFVFDSKRVSAGHYKFKFSYTNLPITESIPGNESIKNLVDDDYSEGNEAWLRAETEIEQFSSEAIGNLNIKQNEFVQYSFNYTPEQNDKINPTFNPSLVKPWISIFNNGSWSDWNESNYDISINVDKKSIKVFFKEKGKFKIMFHYGDIEDSNKDRAKEVVVSPNQEEFEFTTNFINQKQKVSIGEQIQFEINITKGDTSKLPENNAFEVYVNDNGRTRALTSKEAEFLSQRSTDNKHILKLTFKDIGRFENLKIYYKNFIQSNAGFNINVYKGPIPPKPDPLNTFKTTKIAAGDGFVVGQKIDFSIVINKNPLPPEGVSLNNIRIEISRDSVWSELTANDVMFNTQSNKKILVEFNRRMGFIKIRFVYYKNKQKIIDETPEYVLTIHDRPNESHSNLIVELKKQWPYLLTIILALIIIGNIIYLRKKEKRANP